MQEMCLLTMDSKYLVLNSAPHQNKRINNNKISTNDKTDFIYAYVA